MRVLVAGERGWANAWQGVKARPRKTLESRPTTLGRKPLAMGAMRPDNTAAHAYCNGSDVSSGDYD